ncbi:hypothetical protein [Nonomuraea sp. NPDC049695]|uniref:hypothetical protein n=1 Tax=Nonomuraea sp. NPDC049695 TaxID=3154734 RepID=UPI0034392E3E
MAIVGLHLCGGAATPVGAFDWYGGVACGAARIPPPSGTGPQAARPDGGRAEGRRNHALEQLPHFVRNQSLEERIHA